MQCNDQLYHQNCVYSTIRIVWNPKKKNTQTPKQTDKQTKHNKENTTTQPKHHWLWTKFIQHADFQKIALLEVTTTAAPRKLNIFPERWQNQRKVIFQPSIFDGLVPDRFIKLSQKKTTTKHIMFQILSVHLLNPLKCISNPSISNHFHANLRVSIAKK